MILEKYKVYSNFTESASLAPFFADSSDKKLLTLLLKSYAFIENVCKKEIEVVPSSKLHKFRLENELIPSINFSFLESKTVSRPSLLFICETTSVKTTEKKYEMNNPSNA